MRVVVALLVMLNAISLAGAQQPFDKSSTDSVTKASGTLKSAEGGRVTIQTGGGELKLTITKSTKAHLDGKTIDPLTLKKGTSVEVWYQAGKNVLVNLVADSAAKPGPGNPKPEARPPVVNSDHLDGEIKSIDAAKRQFTIRRDNGKETSFRVDKDTEFTMDRKPAAFAALKPGREVRVMFTLREKIEEKDFEGYIAGRIFVYVDTDRPPWR